MEIVEFLSILLCVAAYLALVGCFLFAVETRRFNTRLLLLATTAAAIMTGILSLLWRDSN